MKMAKANLFQKPRRALIKLWLAGRMAFIVIAIAIIMISGAKYFYDQTEHVLESTAEVEAATVAREIARHVATKLRTRLLDTLRIVDEDLAGNNAGPNSATIAGLAGKIDGLRVTRLFAPGQYQVDYTAKPPVNYATLALLRSAERSAEDPKPEVYFSENISYVNYVHRIELTGDKPALLLLVFEQAVTKGLLESAPMETGYVELLQVIKGSRPVVFAEAGNPSVRQGPAHQALPVKGTAWRIAFWHPELVVAPESEQDGLQLYAAIGGALLALLAAIGFVIRRRRKAQDVESTLDGTTPIILPRRPMIRPDVGEPIPADLPGGGLADETPAQDGVQELAATTDTIPGMIDQESQSSPAKPSVPLSDTIFRAYDIRGVVGKDLNADIVYDLGRAIGSEAYDRGQQALMVGRDGRTTSPELSEALIRGLLDSGRDVVDVGRVPTPLLYFAAEFSETRSGVMVTGSHNPKEYNGLKIMLDGETLFDEKIAALKTRIESGQMESGHGSRQEMDIAAEYIRRITEEIPVALGNSLSLVVDCGNGVAGDFAPKMFRALGHDVHELHCEVDGNFPNHPADPSCPENLRDLIAAVGEHDADLGLAFDGDGDRLGVVDGDGGILWADRQLMLFARDVLAENKGATVVYDVKCSTRLKHVIEKLGGKPLMWKTGHSFMKNKLIESGALLAGEMSGHIFFKDRWYGFDDALFAGARLIEILMGFDEPPAAVFARLPAGKFTPELRIDIGEGEAARVLERIKQNYSFDGAQVIDIDGIRVEYPNAWAVIRASNTEPSLVIRCEGDDDAALATVEAVVKEALEAAGTEISPPF